MLKWRAVTFWPPEGAIVETPVLRLPHFYDGAPSPRFPLLDSAQNRVTQTRSSDFGVCICTVIACLSQEQNACVLERSRCGGICSKCRRTCYWGRGRGHLKQRALTLSCPASIWLVWEVCSIILSSSISCIFLEFSFSPTLLGQVKLMGMKSTSTCTPDAATLPLLLSLKSCIYK